MQNRLAVIEDLSCFGKCSLSVALPVLACMGLECCPVPTAILSGHFAALPEVSVLDLTDHMAVIADQWAKGGVTFAGILSGYLSSVAQVQQVQDFVRRFRGPEAIFVADPAMADRGALYRGFTADHVAAMKSLCAGADVVVPNVTEACLMLGLPYRERQDQGFLAELAQALPELGAKAAVLTGISLREDQMSIACCQQGTIELIHHSRVPGHYNGTGDIFASVLTGALLQGAALSAAARQAAWFTSRVIAETAKNPAHRPYGVDLEPWLHLLMQPATTADCQTLKTEDSASSGGQ